tara:strand:- start:1127 stop:1393 length:267 start_codon:yes stop_codon:yes gene_type:complete
MARRNTMTDIQKELMKKLLEIVFMDWEEEWRKTDCGSMNMRTGEIRNPNILSCLRHNGCPCGGGEKIRAMFGTDELEELYDVLEKMNE